MESLGYLPTALHEMKPIKNDRGGTLYHLALYARHPKAKGILEQSEYIRGPTEGSIFLTRRTACLLEHNDRVDPDATWNPVRGCTKVSAGSQELLCRAVR